MMSNRVLIIICYDSIMILKNNIYVYISVGNSKKSPKKISFIETFNLEIPDR